MSASSDALEVAGERAPHEPGIRNPCIRDVVESHDTRGWNYAWLMPLLGRVLWIDHRDALQSSKGGRRRSGKHMDHGRGRAMVPSSIIIHSASTSHIYYVDPDSRLIDLRFYMQLPNGMVYVTFPIERFYELERDWFVKHGLCGAPTTETTSMR